MCKLCTLSVDLFIYVINSFCVIVLCIQFDFFSRVHNLRVRYFFALKESMIKPKLNYAKARLIIPCAPLKCDSLMKISTPPPHVRWLIKISASSQNFLALLQHTPRVTSVSNLVPKAGTSSFFIHSFYNSCLRVIH